MCFIIDIFNCKQTYICAYHYVNSQFFLFICLFVGCSLVDEFKWRVEIQNIDIFKKVNWKTLQARVDSKGLPNWKNQKRRII